MTPDISAAYDNLAEHYHLIFDDWELSVERQGRTLARVLRENCQVPHGARILDCACGIGTQSLGLAGQGFHVSACDVSPKAIERAIREASQKNLDIQFSVASMLDLSCFADTRFEAVICVDNALPHLETPQQLIRAAEQIRGRLSTGGSFLASIRDYDSLISQRPAVQGPSFYVDQGKRRIVFQVWDWLDERHYDFHLYITREVANGWDTFHTSARYRALRRDEVTEALTSAHFTQVRWLFPDESGFYQPIVLAVAG